MCSYHISEQQQQQRFASKERRMCSRLLLVLLHNPKPNLDPYQTSATVFFGGWLDLTFDSFAGRMA